MIQEALVVLFNFPQADLNNGKPRPALTLKKIPGKYNDWLICMISTRLHQYIEGLDSIISPKDEDFSQSGLKAESVIRVSRLAIVSEDILIGKIGSISDQRIATIKKKLSAWILD